MDILTSIHPAIIVIGLAVTVVLAIICFKWPFIGIALFLITPIVKVNLRAVFPFLAGYSYDIYVAFLAYIGALSVMIRKHKSHRVKYNGYALACVAVLIILAWVTYVRSRAPEAGWKKLLMLSIYVPISVVLPIMYIRTYQQVRTLGKTIAFMGLAAILLLTVIGGGQLETVGASRQTLGYANPLGPANISALGMIAIICYAVIGKNKKAWIAIAFFAPLGLFATIASGTRGAVYGVILAMLAIMYIGKSKKLLYYVFLVPFGLLLFYVMLSQVSSVIQDRFSAESVSDSFHVRMYMVKVSLESWREGHIFLGNGLGDTAYALEGEDVYAYPHNHPVEVLAELGICGLFALLFLYFLVFKRIVFLRWNITRMPSHGAEVAILAGGVVYYLLVSFKSSTFAGWFNGWFLLSAFVRAYDIGIAYTDDFDDPPDLVPHSQVLLEASPIGVVY